MGLRGFFVTLAAALSLTTAVSPAASVAAEHPVLGTGNGVDHATWLTRSLARTSRTFADLGFNVSPVDSYDNGFENGTIFFPDGTYLELFGVHDVGAVASGPESHAAEGPEGLTWVTIDTSSATDTVNYLKTRGHSLFGPESLPNPAAWSYRLAGLEADTLPGRRLYFIEYNDDRVNARRQARPETWRVRETHANGAQGLRSVWVAVRDLAAAENAYRRNGFALGRQIDLPHLQAIGREIPTGDRSIVLVQAAHGSSASTLLGSRSAAFIGASVRVQDLARARSIMAESGVTDFPEYIGPYGRSLLVPPPKAGGSWLELYQ